MAVAEEQTALLAVAAAMTQSWLERLERVQQHQRHPSSDHWVVQAPVYCRIPASQAQEPHSWEESEPWSLVVATTTVPCTKLYLYTCVESTT